MKTDYSSVIPRKNLELLMRGLMDRPKNYKFYPIMMCLWLNKGIKAARRC